MNLEKFNRIRVSAAFTLVLLGLTIYIPKWGWFFALVWLSIVVWQIKAQSAK